MYIAKLEQGERKRETPLWMGPTLRVRKAFVIHTFIDNLVRFICPLHIYIYRYISVFLFHIYRFISVFLSQLNSIQQYRTDCVSLPSRYSPDSSAFPPSDWLELGVISKLVTRRALAHLMCRVCSVAVCLDWYRWISPNVHYVLRSFMLI